MEGPQYLTVSTSARRVGMSVGWVRHAPTSPPPAPQAAPPPAPRERPKAVDGTQRPAAVITTTQFARRAGLTRRYVVGLIRRGFVFGATKTTTGSWRIPETALELFQQGLRPMSLSIALTRRERMRRRWLITTGTEWPSARST